MAEPRAIPRLLIAAPATGQGKTTLAVALSALLRARGLSVAPFKVGPDYLDPTHLRAAAGRATRNLDGWLLPHEMLRALFRRATGGENRADVAIVEGMMGLFDGHAGLDDAGSSAEIARLLETPIVLVLDVSAAARTVAAVVHGLNGFDPRLRLAGVVLNRVAGPGHYALCRDALEPLGVPLLGWIPDDPALTVPERHLGLVMAGEHALDVDALTAAVAPTLEVDGLLALARAAPALPAEPDPLAVRAPVSDAVIGVARDAAFGFYYEDNLDLLRACGAELQFFSPLYDERLPEAGALYLGGGYPELHAERLFINLPMRRAIREFAERGGVVYAECGGLMYLSRELVDQAGARHRMVGLVPAVSRISERVTIGYRDLEVVRDSPIAVAGQELRGHEFHHSVLDRELPSPAYRRRGGSETEGIVTGPRENVLASYIHVHFGTDLGLAERFAAAAR